jgi:SAM-dependent methyltransferase
MKNGKKYLGDPHKAKQKWQKKQEKERFLQEAKSGNLNLHNAATFWDKEYSGESENFSLSTEASEDLKKFVRWLEREYKGQQPINKNTRFVDAGCGNGRNSFYLAENFGAVGIGYDISEEAINVANKKLKTLGKKVNLTFSVQNLNKPIPTLENSQDLVIDAVASHVLKKEEREFFKQEVSRVLTPGSYYFLKSLLLDDDSHAKQMIRDYGEVAGEKNSYIHPTMGIFEHVPREEELVEFYSEDFFIDKIERSFAHRVNGRANKRRYIVMYLRKK